MAYQSRFFATDDILITTLVRILDHDTCKTILSETADDKVKDCIDEGNSTAQLLNDAWEAKHETEPGEPIWMWYSIVYYKMEEIVKKQRSTALSPIARPFVPASTIPSPSPAGKNKDKVRIEPAAVPERNGEEKDLVMQGFTKRCESGNVRVSKSEDN
ncbi:uncharacterized protein PG986_002666 [Apiospora aurea]|uniref:Uncharacterized protein n=1 Tax=Apiospora aurea TaxID=335848 RepID=A0ABR1QR54_9PEZI